MGRKFNYHWFLGAGILIVPALQYFQLTWILQILSLIVIGVIIIACHSVGVEYTNKAKHVDSRAYFAGAIIAIFILGIVEIYAIGLFIEQVVSIFK